MGEAIARRKLLTMFWNDIKYTASLVLPDMERNLIRPPGAVAERTLLRIQSIHSAFQPVGF